VADYRPAAPASGKRAKSAEPWRVDLVPTLDVARALGERKNGSVLVTFGAEHGAAGLARKRRMLDSKNADLVVYNDVGVAGIAFDSDENEVVLVTRSGERTVTRRPKAEVAAAVLDEVERLLAEGA
jgi:phosphopantothenoylcysteine decarboxylase / phosphopantothenate---cysteine ligase